MNLKNPRAIRTAARESLAVQSDHPKVALVYAGFSALLSLAVTIISYILAQQIDRMTGLSNMGTRAVLSTVRSVLPVAQLIFLLGWELSYLMCALGFARRRTMDLRNLKDGFTRFGAILRAKILMALVYLGMAIVAMYLSSFIFMALPVSRAFFELMMPLMDSVTVLNPAIVIDDATLAAATEAMWPAFVIFGVVFVVMALPTVYGFRMVSFCIADNGATGALGAMRASRAMMKGRKLDLFRLDLSFWWFFLLEGLISVIAYLDMILPLIGVSLPLPETVSYYGFYVLSLGSQVALYWAFLNRVSVSRAVFYDAVRPQPVNNGGVTLGNIFDLARDYQE